MTNVVIIGVVLISENIRIVVAPSQRVRLRFCMKPGLTFSHSKVLTYYDECRYNWCRFN